MTSTMALVDDGLLPGELSVNMNSADSNVPVLTAGGRRTRKADRAAGRLEMIKIAEIVVSAKPIRRRMDDESVAELSASIASQGLLQPLQVRRLRAGGASATASFELVFGCRRLIAAKAAGLEEVPCIVRDYGDSEALQTAIIENVQRADLTPLEEAELIARLRDDDHLSVRRISDQIKKGRGWVQDRLALIDMPADLQEMVSGRPDSLTHARELRRLDDPAKRADLIAKVVRELMPLEEVRRAVRAALKDSDCGARTDVAGASNSDEGVLAHERKARTARGIADDPATSRTDGSALCGDQADDAEDADRQVKTLMGDLRTLTRDLQRVRPSADAVLRQRLYDEMEQTVEVAWQTMDRIKQYGEEDCNE